MANDKDTAEVTLYLRDIAEPITVSLNLDVAIDLTLQFSGSGAYFEKQASGAVKIPLGDPDNPINYLYLYFEDIRAIK